MTKRVKDRLNQSIWDGVRDHQRSIAAHAAHVHIHPDPGQYINTTLLDADLKAAGVDDLTRMSEIMRATNYNNLLNE